MQQHAVPETSVPQDEEHDDLRLQVEQIIAQRLERRNLMKSKSEDVPEDTPAHVSASAASPQSAPAVADQDSLSFGDPLEEEIGEETSLQSAEELPPLRDLPSDEHQSAPEPTPRMTERRKSERRQGERRNMEFLRTEIQWSTSPEDEEKSSLLSGVSRFKPSRLVLLIVASVSAAVAAGLALTGSPPPAPDPVEPAVIEAPVVPTARILVAANTIGAGQRLEQSSLTWHEVPESDVLPEYVAESAAPDALATADKSIARYPFFPGDPIRSDKLLDKAQQSLSMSLTPGMRGVSVVVTPETAAGGFVKPDDRVDVVLAANGTTRTVLHNIRVLAINTQLGPSSTGDAAPDAAEIKQTFEGVTRATLELDQQAAEVLVASAMTGSLTLTLRSSTDPTTADTTSHNDADQAIRMTSPFWNDTYSPGIE